MKKEIFKNLKRKISFLNRNRRRFLIIFLIAVSLEFAFLVNFFEIDSFKDILASISPDTLVRITNVRRFQEGVEMLDINPLLEEAAKLKAEDMGKREYFAHTSPDGKTPWYWFEKVGYDYRYAGENLAVNFTDPFKLDEAWMSSPGHRSNIINENFDEIGIGTAEGLYKGRRALFVVQLFGRRQPFSIIEPQYLSDQHFKSEESKNINESRDIAGKESFALIKEIDGDPHYTVIDPDNLSLPDSLSEYETILSTIFRRFNPLGIIVSLSLFGIFLLSLIKGRKKLITELTLFIGVIFIALFTSHSLISLIDFFL